MKGRKPNIAALPGALDKAPPAPTWLPKFAKAEWALQQPRSLVWRPFFHATNQREGESSCVKS